MKKLFEKQLEVAQPLSKEALEESKQKTYFNGEEKKLGDVVLFAVLSNETVENSSIDEFPKVSSETIQLNERHFDLFVPIQSYEQSILPKIKFKN